jgi:hypothetical protein
MRTVVCRMALALALFGPAFPTAHPTASARVIVPDFSGHWRIHVEKSNALAREAKEQASPVFGEECIITQTAELLSLEIAIDTLKLEAIYRLDGKPSENRSPGARGQPEIPIVSTTRWVGDTLEIATKSESELRGAKVQVASVRRMWLTADGDLAVDRHGTPSQVVSSAWSVYQRVKAEAGMFTRYNVNRP